MLQRLVEAGVSVVVLLLLTPLLLIIGVAIWMTDGGPVFYRQIRAGHHGRSFTMYKFRTMKQHNQGKESQLTDAEAEALITAVGGLMRRTKLDELPQLINVIRGEMAWVGPRPTLPSQVAEYSEFQWRRLEVRPGMTGWAQVNGGTEVSWEDRIRMEVWYVEHRTLLLDLTILMRTPLVMLLGNRPNPAAIEQAPHAS